MLPVKIFFVALAGAELFSEEGKQSPRLHTYAFETGHAALAHIHTEPDLVFVGDLLSDFSSLEFLVKIKELSPVSSIIFVATKPVALKTVVALMKAGAKDYWEFNDLSITRLELTLGELTGEHWALKEQKSKLDIIDKFRDLGFVGQGRIMRKMYKNIDDAAKTENPVLIESETGCEHYLVAETIHKLSKRQSGPFVLFDVLSFPEDMLEYELFGREKDVFAGILKRKIGAIESASGGTLVLENVEVLSTPLQSRLLRALREKKYLKPGGQNIVFFNTRLIAITRQSLHKAIQNKHLRDDLFYQILGFPIMVPPLRKRGQDILTLANNILRDFLRRNKLKSTIFTQEAKDKLLDYYFPGNVQELRMIVESAALLNQEEIDIAHLSLIPKQPTDLLLSEELTMEQYTEKIIEMYLDKYEGDVLLVAKKLAIGKSTIYRLLKAKKE